jgi:DNA modification methylase
MECKLMCGDVIDELHKLDDKSINTCVTSPPYYGLRDYGTGTWEGGDSNCPHYRTSKRSDITSTGHAAMVDSGHPVGDAIYKTVCPICGAVRVDNQIGLEESPEEYINRLVEVFREVKRVLRDDGILWVNIGDSYSGSHGNGYKQTMWASNGQYNSEEKNALDHMPKKKNGCKPKDLIGIPWMLAFALRADGWYLRQDIIWAKNNPMPESVKDRCTRSHEYIFMLTKSRKYYFDHEAMLEEAIGYDGRKDTLNKGSTKFSNGNYMPNGKHINSMAANGHERWNFKDGVPMRNKRDVWRVGVCSSVKDAHFAVFPKELIEPCILAGCPEGGWVLDPFSGSGTTGIVSLNHGRNYIGIDLNPEYNKIAERRLEKECMNVFIVCRKQ